MGAYSPAPVLSAEVEARAMEEIVRPTIAEMKRRGTPFQGVLYAGLMIKDGQPRLVEYNVRFGDPECQVLMMRLGAQAMDLMHAAAEGRLGEMRVNWADDHAMTVVMARTSYPSHVLQPLHSTPVRENTHPYRPCSARYRPHQPVCGPEQSLWTRCSHHHTEQKARLPRLP